MRRQASDCPFGGNFYKCSAEFGGFSGCCTTEPCAKGDTCAKGNDRSPGRFTPALTTITTRATSASKEAEVTFAILPVSTIVPFQSSTKSAPATSSSDGTLSTAYVTGMYQPSATSLAIPGSAESRRIPIAIIAAAVVGVFLLIALGIFLFLCCKRRKHKSIHQAPIYVSPYNNNDSDMPQKSRFSYKANFASFDGVQQLDSREVGKPWCSRNASSRCCAELPAEPVTRGI